MSYFQRLTDRLKLRLALALIPAGYGVLPLRLSAENGAKYLLIGEFHESVEVPNPEFDPEADDDRAEGTMMQRVPVEWTTIKEIWARAADSLRLTGKATRRARRSDAP